MIVKLPVTEFVTIDINTRKDAEDIIDILFAKTKLKNTEAEINWWRHNQYYLRVCHDEIQSYWTRSSYISWMETYCMADRNKHQLLTILLFLLNIKDHG